MRHLPSRPNLEHLRGQAKSLLRAVKSGDPDALKRVAETAPHLLDRPEFKLHDAQSLVAREYGFPSWADLKTEVETRAVMSLPEDQWHAAFAALAIGMGFLRAKPAEAARLYSQAPQTIHRNPWLACTVGHVPTVTEALNDLSWANKKGGPFSAPPLVMATHSALVKDPRHRDGVFEVVRALLASGADVNGSYIDPEFPGAPLSALYGAAGRVLDPEMTRLLLEAGADPNDNESLYHSCEGDDLTCTRLLLEAGARTEGTNALFRCLDFGNLERLKLLLAAGADPNATLGHVTVIGWAIYRHRDAAHVQALLDAGADPAPRHGLGSYATHALRYGLPDVARLFGPAETTPKDEFVSLAARGDVDGARQRLDADPTLLSQLDSMDLRLLPDLAQAGDLRAVESLVRLGWPIDAKGGDWSATALNLAVFRGDVAMTRFLLDNGAHWTETHGHGDTAVGTLSFASMSEPFPSGDYLGCAKELVAHGMPVDFDKDYTWPAAVSDLFAEVRLERQASESL